MNSPCSPGALLRHEIPPRILTMWVLEARVVRDKPLLKCKQVQFYGAINFLPTASQVPWTPQIVDHLKSSGHTRRSPFAVPLVFLGDTKDLMLIYFRGRQPALYNPLGNCELSCRLW